MILTKLMFIFMQKGTAFINTCCFSFDLEQTLVWIVHDFRMSLTVNIVCVLIDVTTKQ